MKNQLIELLKKYSVKYSDTEEFTLASGTKSRFYVNCKPAVLRSEGLYLVGNLVFQEVVDLEIDAIGGLTFGADPVSIAASFASYSSKKPFKAFSIRKEKKDHGISKWIEGDVKKGERVVIIDDVATTGGSTIKAIERAKLEGLNVVAAVILVDREEGGIENISIHVPIVRKILKKSDLI
ncbi:MAG: orotate phosphoribosyltransferase [Desulforegulaceae bacterium]|nr:orotate phosphoribosyltransferase [Desulforegulaceae bacterium]